MISENAEMNQIIIQIILAGFIIYICGCENDGIFNPSDSLNQVPIIEVYVDNDSYLNLLTSKTLNYEIAAKVYFKNLALGGKIRPAGAGSRYGPRWSYRIKLNEKESIENLNSFNLSAQVNDPTMLYTTIVSDLYRQLGFLVFENFPVFLKINNNDQGLFTLIELVKEDFFERRAIPVYELYKGGSESKFSFEETNNPQFNFDKEIPENDNYSNLYELILAVDTSNAETIFSSLGKWLDIDNYVRYHALTTLINNPDAFQNNFFIIKETSESPFKFIPWDFDRCFEKTNDVGLYGKNAIIKKLFENDSTFSLYKSELEFQIDQIFTEAYIFPKIDSAAAVIKDAYNIDPYLGDGRYDFETEIQTLKEYITNRRQYFIDNLPAFTRGSLD